MKKREICTADAPRALGPYSQAVIAGGFIYVSGQIPVSPVSGRIEDLSISGQTRRSLENIENILKAGGSCLADVVRTTIYITDISMFGEMNDVYEKFFSRPYPARSCVEVSSLPKGALIEIDAVAYA